MKANQATAEVFFTAFKALGNKEREAFYVKLMPQAQKDLDGFSGKLLPRGTI